MLSCHRKLIVSSSENTLSFGVVADCQYCQVVGTGTRKYSISDAKLRACVDHLNTLELDHVVHLGDFIDRDWESFSITLPIYDRLQMPHFQVLGNHDFSVADDKKLLVREKMGLPHEYYDFAQKGWRFVILNGNDISFHAYPKGSEGYNLASQYYTENRISAPKWNGAIGAKQLEWLEHQLAQASAKQEKVVIYCHFPVYPENEHNLWNADELIDLFERHSCVVAYMNGHNHAGNYAQKKGIHYVTFKGMVDTEENSYGVVEVYKDRLEILGFGREVQRTLLINK